MISETLESGFADDIGITLLLSIASLLVVSVPFYRGVVISLRALAATRYFTPAEIDARLRRGADGRPSVTLQMLRVLQSALRESRQEAHPTEFLVDASRQYVSNEYEAHYSRPISMCANILPPIGFIGTTGGLLILFLSMRIASESLELGALALALTSSIFALIGFAVLEGLKFRLYHRLLARLDDALTFFRSQTARAERVRSG